MRLFMDSVVALMLVALLGGVMWHNRTDQTDHRLRDTTQGEVRRFQQQVALQSTLGKVERNERGYPQTIDPAWFQGALPQNPLLDVTHPWLEIASPDQKELLHPIQRIATDKKLAKFWYNPHMGVIRARVPMGVSDEATLQMYNYVNDCDLPDIFAATALIK